MTIREVATKSATTLYIRKSFRKKGGGVTSKNIVRLGTLEEIMARDDCDGDPRAWARSKLEEYRRAEKEGRRLVMIKLDPSKLIERDKERCFNGGYLFLQQQYFKFGLDRIFGAISKRRKFEFDLDAIARMLIFARVIEPSSKRASLEFSRKFIEQPELKLHQVYRALGVFEEESDYIQGRIFKNTNKVQGRKIDVVYYDGSNVFFECMCGDGFREFGPCKEHRPSPIVQIGLYMDMNGIPLAIVICSGDTGEQKMMIPLQTKMEKWFNEDTHVIHCTDAIMASYTIRDHNSMAGRDFICVQPIKKLSRAHQGWCMQRTGWKRKYPAEVEAEMLKDEVLRKELDREYDLDELEKEDAGKEGKDRKYHGWTFYRERWIRTEVPVEYEAEEVVDGKKTTVVKTKKVELPQRLIATFSFKYRDYLREKRKAEVEKAEKIVSRGKAAVENKKDGDPRRYISGTNFTKEGEVAENTIYSIDRQFIEQEERYDGFYAICTSLEYEDKTAAEILEANGGRWIIEDCFRILKHDLLIRPVYVSKSEHIIGHIISCFIAVILLIYLLRRVNLGRHEDELFSVHELVRTLRDMNFIYVEGEGYIPAYKRTELTDRLHGSAGFRTDTEIVTRKKMNEIIAMTKMNSEKLSREKKQTTS